MISLITIPAITNSSFKHRIITGAVQTDPLSPLKSFRVNKAWVGAISIGHI
jgi:hypothetical protein